MEEVLVREFFDAWSLYDQILDYNYMFHDELYESVKNLLDRQYSDRPLRILDLGCGSARHFAPVLKQQKIEYYCGYDLSEIAIAEATQNLDFLQGVMELQSGDLLTGLKETTETFDLIFSSFALHHLSLSEKSQIFALAFDKLNESGVLLLIDITRSETENLTQYFEHYSAWIQSEWTAIAQSGKESIYEHIRNHDFPETVSSLQAMAHQAGFGTGDEISHFRWHRALSFEKKLDPILCPHCLRTATNQIKCKGICIADNDY